MDFDYCNLNDNTVKAVVAIIIILFLIFWVTREHLAPMPDKSNTIFGVIPRYLRN